MFTFDVNDKLVNVDGTCSRTSDPLGCDTGNKSVKLLSPKVGITLGPYGDTSFFLCAAEGYHSNDARGLTRRGEPANGAAATPPLTRAKSAEMGIATDHFPRWHSSLDAFFLKIGSELVFAGDTGTTVPSGSITRTGLEWGNTLRLYDWLRANLNAAVSRGRFDRDVMANDTGCSSAAKGHGCIGVPAIVGRYIPNSPIQCDRCGVDR